MRAALITAYNEPLSIETVPDPDVPEDGIVLEVKSTGVCRSDWHTWVGAYDIELPAIPGHEMAGVVAEVGNGVKNLSVGDRVTTPFVLGCGICPKCHSGNHQVCNTPFTPGFGPAGSFAEYVALPYAQYNVVRLPDDVAFAEAASMGCRFITAYRGVVEQGRVGPGEWIAVHGCGGVGLSAIMIASAVGALPIAVDINDQTLELAKSIGAVATVNARDTDDVGAEIQQLTKGGAHVSVDALGSRITCLNSIRSLGVQGRHVQIGLMEGADATPDVPMGLVISKELELLGSYGMSSGSYPGLFEMIRTGKVSPAKLIAQEVSLEEGAQILTDMDNFPASGVTVITQF